MNEPSIEQAFADLFDWCRRRDFAGHDPFDALNSRVFQSTPLRGSRIARLVSTQLMKRSPLNLRLLARVPSQRNSKGIALFALAALASHRRLQTAETETGARELLDDLQAMRLPDHSGAAWGYNFAWQSRDFFAPQGTPMIVPTAFAARAMIEGYQVFGDENYLKIARSSCDFILSDLTRTFESAEEICFSYSPLDATRIFNASLLAGETLASVGVLTGETGLCDLALRTARYVVRHQRDDGSWGYGMDDNQQWTDNFHTAYVLLSLRKIAKCGGGDCANFDRALRRGFEFWRDSFFLADGWPKYYHDSLYPADAHAAGSAIITLLELQDLDPSALSLAERIATWTVNHLRDRRGFFFYQRRHFYTVRTPYMRWTQSWMLYALGRLLEAKKL